MEEKKNRANNPDYKGDLRRNGYYHIDDKKYPSVTTILQVIAKPMLISWSARVAATSAIENPDYDVEQAVASVFQRRDSAGNLGKTIHSLVEAIGKGSTIENIDIPIEYLPYKDAFVSFWNTYKPTILHTECVVVDKTNGYAGTCDLICTINDVVFWLIDYKTGKNIYPKELSLQLSAYRHADYIYNKQTKEKISIPKIDKIAGVHLKPDGTFSFVEVEDNFPVFLAVKKLWHYQNEDNVPVFLAVKKL